MENYNTRYARHYSLNNFGSEGQQKLANAKVLVIGAGGLGCPVLQYLAAAGVGTIGLADNDVVSLSNLQRQVLYSTEDIGRAKASVGALKLQQLNPDITIESYKMMVSNDNALDLIASYDIVIDCTDNFAARYLINDACVLLDKPLIFGAVYQYEGQVAVFNVEDINGNKTNYRNLFATPPDPLEVADCNEAGVLGVLPGIIGIMQATEAIKLLTGIGEVLANKLLTFSILDYSNFVIEVTPDDSVHELMPRDKLAFKNTDYNWLCGISFLQKANLADTLVIDVREEDELPKVHFSNLNIPLSALSDKMSEIGVNNVLLFCQSGKRSLKAGKMLLEKFGNSRKISHLQGGIIALQEDNNE
jgi:molybdopterin/thiamine biosynthesis adenylyltransferase/rhodanese-related sulfurtransferase